MSLGGYTIGLNITDAPFLVLLLLVGFFLTFRAYRPSRPGLNLHFILFISRSLAITLSVFLLMAPKLTVNASGVRPPLIAVLVDDSESMRIRAGEHPRYQAVTDLLNSGVFERLADRARVRMFRFSEKLEETGSADTTRWQGQATDIATSLTQLSARLQGEGLSGVFLLSDGATNVGRNPLTVSEELGTPIYAVPIGSEHPPRDVALTSVSHPSLGYVGRPIQIKVSLDGVGMDRVENLIRVYDGDRVMAVVPVVISSGTQEVIIDVIPEEQGVRSLRISLPALEGEVERRNNQVLSRIEILAGRARVLLVGTPSADFAYLRRVVYADSSVTVQTIYPDSPQGWRSLMRSALGGKSDYDLVILHDVPASFLTSQVEAQLEEAVRGGGALLVVGGEQALIPGWGGGAMERLLPIQYNENGYETEPVRARLPENAAHHSIMRLSEDAASDREAWEGLPPFLGMNRVRLREGAGARALLEDTNTGTPLMAIRNFGEGKVAAVAATGFARQALMMWGIGDTDSITQSFWKRLIQWLLTKEDVAKLRVATEKMIYRSGEPITFRVEFFDALLRPIDGAEVLVDVGGEPARTAILPGRGNGVYVGTFPGLPQGVHEYRVTARREGESAASVTRDLTVGRYSIEFEDLLPHVSLMGELARRSGGRLLQIGDVPSFVDAMKLSPQPHISVYQLNLWGREWPLFFLVFVLAGEWFIRRRRGMV